MTECIFPQASKLHFPFFFTFNPPPTALLADVCEVKGSCTSAREISENAGLGDQFAQTQSNNSAYSQWSNLANTFMTLSL